MDTFAPIKKSFAKKALFKLRWFFNSKFYPPILIFFVLISHTFSIEELGIAIVLSSASLGLFVCDDLKFLITPLITFILMFSEKSVATGKYYDTPYVIAIICGASVFVSFLVAHFIIYRKNVSIKQFLSSKLASGLIILSVAILLNGFLNFDEYKWGNFAYAVALAFSILGIFFLFYINTNKNESLIKYVIYVLYLSSILVTLELFIAFTNQIQIIDGEIVKESVKIGWGMWNNIGGFLAFLLPVHFYYASTVKRFGPIFYLTGLISFVAIVLTLSRSSLLSAGLVIVLSAIVSCFKGVNKLANRIMTGIMALLGIIGIILLWDKISTILGDYLARGLDDNGRFEMYLHGLFNFIENPIFGGGFTSSYHTEHMFIHFMPYRYHNTIIQMMATCGLFGIMSYFYHRYQTIQLLISKKRLSSVFIALCLVAFLSSSMLDNHFFNIYPGFIYAIMLMAIEKSTNRL